jgi:ribonuclease-3
MYHDQLERIIGYHFTRNELLDEAMTHPSLSNADNSREKRLNYERLEFLGDSVLGLLIAEILIEMYPDEREGGLAKRHSWLVRGETIAEIGRRIDIGRFLKMTDGEEQTGGRSTGSNLEDAVEALMGAIYLDGGLEPVRNFVRQYWLDIVKSIGEPPKDAKTELQEWLQGRGLPLPKYDVIQTEGPAHSPTFTISLTVPGYETLTATGPSRKKAEKEVAESFLTRFSQ